MLVYAVNASLNAVQRRAMSDWFKQHNPLVAVFTASRATRGALTALSWFGLPARAFLPTPAALREGLEFVKKGELHDTIVPIGRNTCQSSLKGADEVLASFSGGLPRSHRGWA